MITRSKSTPEVSQPGNSTFELYSSKATIVLEHQSEYLKYSNKRLFTDVLKYTLVLSTGKSPGLI